MQYFTALSLSKLFMLKNLDRNLWVAEQPLKFWGVEVGTRMTIIRLTNGELIAISPIDCDRQTINQINELGSVTVIIAPNLYHHLFVAEFKAIYPEAQICAAPDLGFKRPDLPIDKTLTDGSIGLGDEIEHLFFEGFNFFDLPKISSLNEVVFFHRASQTLILTDTAYHFDRSFPWITQLSFRILGGYQKLQPSLLEKLATRDRDRVKKSIKRVLDWDFQRAIVAHGSIVDRDAKSQLKAGYESFLSTTL
jgi:hypothetical protein